MKKIYNYLFIGIVAMLSMTLSSCNNDDYDAGLLAGYWEGEITSSGWRTGTFNYVDFYFEKDPSYGKGHGWERDYDEYGYIVDESEFDYEVINGSLRLLYYDLPYPVWIDRWNIYGRGNVDVLEATFRYNGKTVNWYLERRGYWRSTYYSKDFPFTEVNSDEKKSEEKSNR